MEEQNNPYSGLNLMSPYAVQLPNVGGGNYYTQPGTPEDLVLRGREAERILYGGAGPQLNDIPDGLAEVEGLTQEVYDKWAKLKGFAQTLWNNYRIDVTRPDLSNPLAVQAHNAFNKMLASIQYDVNTLKNYQNLITKTQEAFLQGHGFYTADPTKQVYKRPVDFFQSSQIPYGVQMANQYNATDAQTREAFKAKKEEQDILRRRFDELIKRARESGDEATAKQLEYQKNFILDPQYEEPYQIDPNYLSARRRYSSSFMDHVPYFNDLLQFRQGLLMNDPSTISRFKEKNPDITDVRVYSDGEKYGLLLRRLGPDKRYRLERIEFSNDPKNPSEVRYLNDLLNRGLPAKYQVSTSLLGELYKAIEDGDVPLTAPKINPTVSKAINNYVKVLKNGEATFKNADGTNVTIERSDFIDDLQALADQGQLWDTDGEPISKVVVKGTFWGWQTPRLVLYQDDGSGTPVEYKSIALENEKDLKQLLITNSGLLPGISLQATDVSGLPTEQLGTSNPRTGKVTIQPSNTQQQKPLTQEQMKELIEDVKAQRQNQQGNKK